MRPLALAALLLAGLPGCGNAFVAAELKDIRKRLDEVEQSRSELTRKVEELDNRVFLLMDQVESHKVALARRGAAGPPPRLPVVTLKPPPREPDNPGGDPAILRSLEEGDEAAAATPQPPPPPVPSGPRPKLTLNGGEAPWLDDGGGAPRPTGAPEATGSPVRKARRPPPGSSAAAHRPLGSTDDRPPTPAAPADDATSRYREAYGLLRDGRPAEAEAALRAFVQQDPQHDLADNAQYWLGECFYARAAYREATLEFRAVVRRWPGGNKVPDALLKLAFSHLALGETDKGRAVLVELSEHYPRTDAAVLAARRLAELPPENRSPEKK